MDNCDNATTTTAIFTIEDTTAPTIVLEAQTTAAQLQVIFAEM